MTKDELAVFRAYDSDLAAQGLPFWNPQVDVTANPCSSQACVPPVILLAFR